jgi:xanthine phosphoribosyltransferase
VNISTGVRVDAPFEPLVRRIVEEATVENDRILKIDHFLNHRIEPGFMAEMGEAMADRIRQFEPDLLLTAEASGIAPALATAFALDVPVVYAKKYSPVVEPPALSRVVPSPTKGGETRLVVASRYLQPGTRVAIIDDFLANGKTAVALAEIVLDAHAQTVVAGFLVEKLFQNGRAPLESMGIPIATLAQVEKLQEGHVIMAGR